MATQGGKGFTYRTYDANSSFTVPAGVTQLILIGCGGGSGGQGGCKAIQLSAAYGGFGSTPTMQIVSVTPNSTYSITIGTGGAGGTGRSSTGLATVSSAGGDTTFGSLALFKGAPAQDLVFQTNPTVQYNAPIILPGQFSNSIYVTGGGAGPHHSSGADGTNQSIAGFGVLCGGTGGASGYGSFTNSISNARGGAGGNANTSTSGSDGQTSPVTPNYGSGGGGGGGTRTGTKGGDGASGQPGMLIVAWVE